MSWQRVTMTTKSDDDVPARAASSWSASNFRRGTPSGSSASRSSRSSRASTSQPAARRSPRPSAPRGPHPAPPRAGRCTSSSTFTAPPHFMPMWSSASVLSWPRTGTWARRPSTAAASSRTSASSGPPPTVPSKLPSSRTSMREPASRGAERSVETTVRRTNGRRAPHEAGGFPGRRAIPWAKPRRSANRTHPAEKKTTGTGAPRLRSPSGSARAIRITSRRASAAGRGS